MLINKELLKRYSPFPRNYDLTEVMNYVDLAEKMYILPLIGNDFYEELLEQVEKNNLTPENSTALVEALYPLLGFAVTYESLPLVWLHISEIGITRGKSDNSDSATLKDLTLAQQHLKNQVQVRIDYAKHWLCEHQDYYSNLDICQCGCSNCQKGKDAVKNTLRDKQLYSPLKRCTDLR